MATRMHEVEDLTGADSDNLPVAKRVKSLLPDDSASSTVTPDLKQTLKIETTEEIQARHNAEMAEMQARQKAELEAKAREVTEGGQASSASSELKSEQPKAIKAEEPKEVEKEVVKCASCMKASDDMFDCANCSDSHCRSRDCRGDKCENCEEEYCARCLDEVDACPTCMEEQNILKCCNLEAMPCGTEVCEECSNYHHKRCGCIHAQGAMQGYRF